MGSYVGIDLHRRRSVVVVLNEDGERVSWSRIDNTPANLAGEIVAAGGADAEVAMEATWGWYWAADVVAECGATLHLAHPLGIAGYENRRVKNDIGDATLLADLLRMGRLPEAWIAPAEIRELREAVRYRAKLARLRAGLKAQVHQTLGKEGVIPELNSIWGPGGRQWLNELRLGDEYVNRIESLRDLIEGYDREIHDCDVRIYRRLKGHPGYEAVQALRGVGPVLAAVFVAEIGDVSRFANADQEGRDPTVMSPAVGSPSRARGCCVGRRSKQSPVRCAIRRSLRSKLASAPGGVATSVASPPPDIC